MEYERVYELSKRYGPPKVDLREAEILDSYGSEAQAKVAVEHRVPEDVTREQLDYYGGVYAFVEETDLLFYLYPVAKAFADDLNLDCIDSFLYSLEWKIESLMAGLNEEDGEALKEGLLWIWEAGGTDYADWVQCPGLQEVIGLM